GPGARGLCGRGRLRGGVGYGGGLGGLAGLLRDRLVNVVLAVLGLDLAGGLDLAVADLVELARNVLAGLTDRARDRAADVLDLVDRGDLVDLAPELVAHPAHGAERLPEIAQHHRQVLGADKDQRHDSDDEYFAPAEAQHGTAPLITKSREGLRRPCVRSHGPRYRWE